MLFDQLFDFFFEALHRRRIEVIDIANLISLGDEALDLPVLALSLRSSSSSCSLIGSSPNWMDRELRQRPPGLFLQFELDVDLHGLTRFRFSGGVVR